MIDRPKKLSAKDEKKALDALTRCAKETQDCKDQKEINRKMASILKEEGITGELAKRACEGYNSAKSIYKLSSADDNTRGDSFLLAQSNEVLKYMGKEASDEFIQKAASAYGIKKINFYKERSVMAKVASCEGKGDGSCGGECKGKEEGKTGKEEDKSKLLEIEIEIKQPSKAEVETEMKDNMDGIEKEVLKANANTREAENEKDLAEDKLISELATVSSEVRKQASELICHKYGKLGKEIIDMFNAKRPLQKIASVNDKKYKGSVRFPDSSLYKSVETYIEKKASYENMVARQDLINAIAVDTIKDMKDLYSSMRKEAAGGISLSTALNAAAGLSVADLISGKNDQFSDPEDQSLRQQIMTANLINRLREHGARRAFMAIVDDDTISKYALADIVDAYNEALKELPPNMRDVPATANEALLRSRVIARLGRGNAPSQADSDEVRENIKAYGKLRDLGYGVEAMA